MASVQKRNAFDILGIPPTSSKEQVTKRWRKLAHKHHPDRNPDDQTRAGELFKEITEAYELAIKTIDNPWISSGAGADGSRVFNFSGKSNRPTKARGFPRSIFPLHARSQDRSAFDIVLTMYITQAHITKDAPIYMRFKQSRMCGSCFYDIHPRLCQACIGTGTIALQMPCQRCSGAGVISLCKTCNGTCFVVADNAYGTSYSLLTSQRLVMKGEGHEYWYDNEPRRGDMIVNFLPMDTHGWTRRVPTFSYEMVVRVPLYKILLRDTIEVTGITGSTLRVNVETVSLDQWIDLGPQFLGGLQCLLHVIADIPAQGDFDPVLLRRAFETELAF
jgi:DnaJ-class molecular chaperone